MPVIIPSEQRVREACADFDKQNFPVEEALKELFRQYHENTDPRHVLLKVAAVNQLYTTNVFAVSRMAAHIHTLQQNMDIDSGLAHGNLEVVQAITPLENPATGRTRRHYSFATKYCSWHNQRAYPIWDTKVGDYLCELRDARGLRAFLYDELWHYPTFVDVVKNLQDRYQLHQFSFKEIDKFLWSSGGDIQTDPLPSTATA